MSTIPPAFEQYGAEPLAQAPAFGPGKSGRFEATLAREPGGKTRLLAELTKVPFHLTGTLDFDPVESMTTLCLQEPTGGVAQGDRHSIDVTARERARAHITTQSATKVHSMQANYAHLDATLTAGENAHLEYLPGPTILNEDARCLQTTTVEMEPSSVVLISDILSPDGLSDHEPFSFDHYTSQLEARCDGELLCVDTVELRPENGRPANPATMGEFSSLGTLYVLAPAEDTEALADRVFDAVDAHPDTAAGVSALAQDGGVSVRILGHRTSAVADGIRSAWAAVREQTLDADIPADRWN